MARLTAPGRQGRTRGAALLVVLAAVTLLSLATLVPLRNEQQAMQRERERELLFIGEQFRQALASYAAATPVGTSASPRQWADLLEDKRFPSVRRHLRRIYDDPMTGAADWALLIEQGVIVGVASASTRTPLRRSGFAARDLAFADAATYADWKFVHRPSTAARAGAPGGSVPESSPPQAPDDGAGLPPASPPEAEGSGRGECLKAYSATLNGCGRDLSNAAACRARAGEALRSCLRA